MHAGIYAVCCGAVFTACNRWTYVNLNEINLKTTWTYVKSIDIKWIQVTSNKIKWTQMKTFEINWDTMKSHDFQTTSDEVTRNPVTPRDEWSWFRRTQMKSHEIIWNQVEAKEFKWNQGRSSEIKWKHATSIDINWNPVKSNSIIWVQGRPGQSKRDPHLPHQPHIQL